MRNLSSIIKTLNGVNSELNAEYFHQRILPSLILNDLELAVTGAWTYVKDYQGRECGQLQSEMVDEYINFFDGVRDIVVGSDFSTLLDEMADAANHANPESIAMAESCNACMDKLEAYYHSRIAPYVVMPHDEYKFDLVARLRKYGLVLNDAAPYNLSSTADDTTLTYSFDPRQVAYEDPVMPQELIDIMRDFPVLLAAERYGFLANTYSSPMGYLSVSGCISQTTLSSDAELDAPGSIYDGMPMTVFNEVLTDEIVKFTTYINQKVYDEMSTVCSNYDAHGRFIHSNGGFLKWVRGTSQVCSCGR